MISRKSLFTSRISTRRQWLPAAAIFALLWVPAALAGPRGIQSHIVDLVRGSNLGQTDVSLLVMDLSNGQKLARIRPKYPMIPASNMKLVTTAAALHTLGADFVFRTELRAFPGHALQADYHGAEEARSNATKTPYGYVLVVHGDGDPGLADPKLLASRGDNIEKMLDRWIDAIKNAGIKRVTHLYVNDRVFDQQFVHPTWPRSQLHRWYCAQVAGVNFYTNCLDVYAQPTKPGQHPRVTIFPTTKLVKTQNLAVTGRIDTFGISRHLGSNRLLFTGKVRHARNKPFNVTVHDPPMVFGHLLAEALRRAGVPVSRVDRVEPDRALPAGTLLHVEQTPLTSVITRCNKDSQNLFAEALIKRMGHKFTGAPGSWANGAAAVRQFLVDTLGSHTAVVSIADGSGLSRDNLITAHVLVELLAAMHRDESLSDVYRQSLSIAHVDGTLAKSKPRMSQRLVGRVFAKTGYINRVSALSGYLVTNDVEEDGGGVSSDEQRVVAFSLLFKGFRPPVYVPQVKLVQDNIIELIDKHLSRTPAASYGG